MKRVLSPFLSLFKSFLLLLINGALFAYAMFQGGFVSWFLFYSVLVVSALTIVAILFSFRGIVVERTFSKQDLYAADSTEVTITIKKRSIHPFFYVRIRDTVPNSLLDSNTIGSGALFFLSFKNELSFQYPISNLPRGKHEFNEVELTLGDLFGFFQKSTRLKVHSSILVYPRLRDIGEWKVRTRRQGGEGTSISLSQSMDEELSIAGVRRYVPGDRLSSIDWKQSARSSSLMTKEFETFQETRFFLGLYSFVRVPDIDAYERAVELAASFVNYFYTKSVSLGFVDYRSAPSVIPCEKQLDNYYSMYRKLALAEMEDESYFELERYRNAVPQGEMIVLITTTLSEEFVSLVQSLRISSDVRVCWTQAESELSTEERERLDSLRRNRVRVFQFPNEEFNQSMI
ncbi:DUF58 domain-containing protein [Bacillus sp. FJAT-45350]|uniref:DUF58 domain-containing protein n=1 Tax=Bacillus sp. FJAT-45350 TaxID=2011014 RepID=UPI000BB8E662|nr:DUF58 domain-containing protein [Bacillus sp. FJAT-45350]